LKKNILVLLLFFSFCTGKEIDNFPFIKQDSDFCGPASLSTILYFYGDNITQEEIAKYVYIPSLKGALITDLENFAKSKGYKTVLQKGNIEDIKGYIDKNIPVIALIDLGFWVISKPHYIVIYGYNEKGFIANTGYEKSVIINYEDFLKKWEKIGKTFLVVYK